MRRNRLSRDRPVDFPRPAWLGEPACPALPLEKCQGRRRVDRLDRRGREAGGIAGHDEFAAGCLGGGGADGVLEIGPAEGQGALEGRLADGGHFKDREQMRDRTPGGVGAPDPGKKIKESRDAVTGHDTPDPAGLDCRPDLRGNFRMRCPLEDGVEQDVDVHEEAFQRYLRSRYFR